MQKLQLNENPMILFALDKEIHHFFFKFKSIFIFLK